MTNDRQEKPAHRFSRYSRSTLDDLASGSRAQPEPSLAEVTARALNAYQDAAPRGAPVRGGWDQPPQPTRQEGWNGRAAGTQAAQHALAGREPPPSPPVPQPQAEPRALAEAPLPISQTEPTADLVNAPEIEPGLEAEAVIRLSAPEDTGPKSPPLYLRAASRTGQLIREKAGPALMKGAFWLAHNLRRREIRKRYNRLLVLGHTRVADRYLEGLFFVPTRQAEMIDPDPARGIHYDGPVPGSAFNWVMSLMPQDLRQFAFVDIRAGRGRTSLLAARYGFNRILAHEWDAAMFDDLEMNVAQYPRSRMTCRRIDCHRADLHGISLPDQSCVIWISSAWREPLIGDLMQRVHDTYRRNPRRFYIVLENVNADTGLEHDTVFETIEPPLAERLKLKLLSPVDFKIYRSSY